MKEIGYFHHCDRLDNKPSFIKGGLTVAIDPHGTIVVAGGILVDGSGNLSPTPWSDSDHVEFVTVDGIDYAIASRTSDGRLDVVDRKRKKSVFGGNDRGLLGVSPRGAKIAYRRWDGLRPTPVIEVAEVGTRKIILSIPAKDYLNGGDVYFTPDESSFVFPLADEFNTRELDTWVRISDGALSTKRSQVWKSRHDLSELDVARTKARLRNAVCMTGDLTFPMAACRRMASVKTGWCARICSATQCRP
ncbi:MAG: hypothetical protein NVSMB1_12620 [Polyangiales bacterium]